MGWYRTKRPMQLRPFFNRCAPHLSSNYTESSTRALCSDCSSHLVAKREETKREIAAEFCLIASLSYLKGSLTCRKILRHGADGFTSPPRKVVLRIFIPLDNPSLSAEFEPADSGYNCRHDNHSTTENDYLNVTVTTGDTITGV
jgi:hypothetical protein